jgi:hypothetical protein
MSARGIRCEVRELGAAFFRCFAAYRDLRDRKLRAAKRFSYLISFIARRVP